MSVGRSQKRANPFRAVWLSIAASELICLANLTGGRANNLTNSTCPNPNHEHKHKHNPARRRLRQFGLSPELTQLGGFASLLLACLGLCGLNYSSHFALNLYG